MKPRFVMPRPYSLVNYCHAKGQPICPALVTGVFEHAISCTIWAQDMKYGVPKDGVRHVDDPEIAMISPDEGGYWDYTEDQKLLRTLVGEDVALAQLVCEEARVIYGWSTAAGTMGWQR